MFFAGCQTGRPCPEKRKKALIQRAAREGIPSGGAAAWMNAFVHGFIVPQARAAVKGEKQEMQEQERFLAVFIKGQSKTGR